jgi:hypothetical protein
LLQDHSRRAAARAIYVHLDRSGLNESATLRKTAGIAPVANELISRANAGEQKRQPDKCECTAPKPTKYSSARSREIEHGLRMRAYPPRFQEYRP